MLYFYGSDFDLKSDRISNYNIYKSINTRISSWNLYKSDKEITSLVPGGMVKCEKWGVNLMKFDNLGTARDWMFVSPSNSYAETLMPWYLKLGPSRGN